MDLTTTIMDLKHDLSKVIEMSDDTNISGELACAGGVCEIT